MGGKTGCADVINTLPLWYSSNDKSSDVANYDQIGGWELGAVKQVSNRKNVCGVVANQDVIFYASTGALSRVVLSAGVIFAAFLAYF